MPASSLSYIYVSSHSNLEKQISFLFYPAIVTEARVTRANFDEQVSQKLQFVLYTISLLKLWNIATQARSTLDIIYYYKVLSKHEVTHT